MCVAGTRVDVWNGDRTKHLGKGTLVGFVPVYIIRNPDHSISSLSDAESKPEGIPEEFVTMIESNPKIELDGGEVVYGCQVWWGAV